MTPMGQSGLMTGIWRGQTGSDLAFNVTVGHVLKAFCVQGVIVTRPAGNSFVAYASVVLSAAHRSDRGPPVGWGDRRYLGSHLEL